MAVVEEIGQDEKEKEKEEEKIEGATGLAAKDLYEVIRREGEEELDRSRRSLMWSGIAAGIMISFSVLGEAIFRTYLPDTPWRYLVENLGYSLGFLLVILGRLQLFTENTITTVLPFTRNPSVHMGWCVIRLWGIVLFANVVGAFAISALYAFAGVIPDDLLPALKELSEHATGMGAYQSFARGIPAGILVAAIVWMMPQANASSFHVILVFTWLIAAGDFTHVVAGSVEMAYLVWLGDLGFNGAVFGFFIPTLFGNIVGGTIVFTMMAWGQVMDEVVRH